MPQKRKKGHKKTKTLQARHSNSCLESGGNEEDHSSRAAQVRFHLIKLGVVVYVILPAMQEAIGRIFCPRQKCEILLEK
jgi:hypothetical protein